MHLFDTWVFAGKAYLAVKNDSGVHVMDANGTNYGAWYSVDRFREMQRKVEKAEVKVEALGKCKVKIFAC
jgi:elongation factor P hydroxylase